jgi:hypothetical protein
MTPIALFAWMTFAAYAGGRDQPCSWCGVGKQPPATPRSDDEKDDEDPDSALIAAVRDRDKAHPFGFGMSYGFGFGLADVRRFPSFDFKVNRILIQANALELAGTGFDIYGNSPPAIAVGVVLRATAWPLTHASAVVVQPGLAVGHLKAAEPFTTVSASTRMGAEILSKHGNVGVYVVPSLSVVAPADLADDAELGRLSVAAGGRIEFSVWVD